MAQQQTTIFKRTRFTWLAYLMLGYYAYLQAAIGPLMPFLSAELHLSYTMEGLHFSAFAFGAFLVGFTGDRVARFCGRRTVLWGSSIAMVLGAVSLTISHQAILTLLSILLMGYAGNLLLMTIQATLSDQHGEYRSVALIEANIIASVGASLAALFVGGLQSVHLGWRSALLLMVVVLLLLFTAFYRVPLPIKPQRSPDNLDKQATSHAGLPLSFWAYWVVILLGVAIEWSVIYWAADFLVRIGGLAKSGAASFVSLFFIAELVGRIIGSRIARMIPSNRLVVLVLGLTIIGFPLFWLVPVLPVRLAGLFLTGLGIANLYPLSISLALGTVPDQTDAASARASLGAGIAILIAPLALGSLADHFNLQQAYSIVALLLVIIIAMIFVANRLARQAVSPSTHISEKLVESKAKVS